MVAEPVATDGEGEEGEDAVAESGEEEEAESEGGDDAALAEAKEGDGEGEFTPSVLAPADVCDCDDTSLADMHTFLIKAYSSLPPTTDKRQKRERKTRESSEEPWVEKFLVNQQQKGKGKETNQIDQDHLL